MIRSLVATMVLTTAMLPVRITSRAAKTESSRQRGLDCEDGMVVVGWVFATAFVSSNLLLTRYGLGEHWDHSRHETKDIMMKFLTVSSSLYTLSTLSMKTAICLSQHRWYRHTRPHVARFNKMLLVLTPVFCISKMLVICVRCLPSWTTEEKQCFDSDVLKWTLYSSTCTMDLLLFGQMLPAAWQGGGPSHQRASHVITIIFGSLLLFVFSPIRQSQIAKIGADLTYELRGPISWSALEVTILFTCICLLPLGREEQPAWVAPVTRALQSMTSTLKRRSTSTTTAAVSKPAQPLPGQQEKLAGEKVKRNSSLTTMSHNEPVSHSDSGIWSGPLGSTDLFGINLNLDDIDMMVNMEEAQQHNMWTTMSPLDEDGAIWSGGLPSDETAAPVGTTTCVIVAVPRHQDGWDPQQGSQESQGRETEPAEEPGDGRILVTTHVVVEYSDDKEHVEVSKVL